MQKWLIALVGAIFAFTSSARADIILRDTISPGSWQGQPTWLVNAQNESLHNWPALTFTGNGERVSRLGVIAMFTDGDSVWNPPTLSADDFVTEIGFFTSQSDWLSDPQRLSVSISSPSNSNWLTPVATYGGINYHYLEFDLSSYNFVTTNGGTNLLSVTFNANGSFSDALGFLAGGLDGVTDYLHRTPPGPQYTGTLNGFYSQIGRPFTNVAGTVAVVPGPGAVPLLGIGALCAFRRRR